MPEIKIAMEQNSYFAMPHWAAGMTDQEVIQVKYQQLSLQRFNEVIDGMKFQMNCLLSMQPMGNA